MDQTLLEQQFAQRLSALNKLEPVQLPDPMPHRARRNRSKHLVLVLACLAILTPTALAIGDYVDGWGVIWHTASGKPGDTESFAIAPASDPTAGIPCILGTTPAEAAQKLNGLGIAAVEWHLLRIDDSTPAQAGDDVLGPNVPTEGIVTQLLKKPDGTLRVEVTVLLSGKTPTVTPRCSSSADPPSK